MPATVHCPQCGHQMPAYDWRRYDATRRNGQCQDCGKAVRSAHVRCADCRLRRAVAMRQKRARA